MRYALVFILLFCKPLWATHIIGGNFQIEQTGAGVFEVSLRIFRDCETGTVNIPPTLEIEVHETGTQNLFGTFIINQVSQSQVQLGNQCFEPRNLCIEEYIHAATINLPPNAIGYTFSSTTCCRNATVRNLVNPLRQGITWIANIPSPSLNGGNSSPVLGPYPTEGYLCLGYGLETDLSASDPDGDSLVYRLVEPYDTSSYPVLNTVAWDLAYNALNPFPSANSFTLNAQTGILTGVPNQLGLYVFAYEVEEYRDGLLIGSVRRDVQFEVLSCPINDPPEITDPVDSVFVFEVGQEQCIDIRVIDANALDTITLSFDFDVQFEGGTLTSESGQIAGSSVVTKQICWTPSCLDALNDNLINARVSTVYKGCNDSIIQKRFQLRLSKSTPDGNSLLPNVFTPNGDGQNDYLKPLEAVNLKCLGGLNIQIFNRWGKLVHSTPLLQLNWDGSFQSQTLSPGVYFYTVEGEYVQQALNLQGTFTLIR
jgi:gliding motility-associated-like protein